MTVTEFEERLAGRARSAGVPLTAGTLPRLHAYYELLARWNAKINLTALPLLRPTDDTFDRLLIEPLAAARYVPESARSWIAVGSGGGSPAIPLKIVQPRAELTMVESKTRKVAFLREAIRTLELPRARVDDQRFEDVARTVPLHSIDLVSIRGVKSASPLLTVIHRIISSRGHVFLFHSPSSSATGGDFTLDQVKDLGTPSGAKLSIMRPVFHVEQSG